MSFNLETVTRIAHLARLSLSDPATLQHDLEQILTMVDQIQAVDTQGIAPMSHPLAMTLEPRQDIVTEHNTWPLLKTLAPKVEADLFLVPKVME